MKLFCEAETSGDDSVSSYAWFETPTGQLKDIVAIGSYGGQPEEDPVLVCDTSTPGTRYYVCYVMTKLGGVAYSSVIPVTVTEKTVVTPPPESSDLTDSQATFAPDCTSEPATTLPSDGETSPAGSSGHTGTDSVPGEKGGSRGTVIIVLAAVCGVILGSCIALAAAAFRKKK